MRVSLKRSEKKFNILIGNFVIFVKFKLTLKMFNYAKVII